jgi:hypothetical protein
MSRKRTPSEYNDQQLQNASQANNHKVRKSEAPVRNRIGLESDFQMPKVPHEKRKKIQAKVSSSEEDRRPAQKAPAKFP